MDQTPTAWALCRDGKPIDIHSSAQHARDVAEELHRQAETRQWTPSWRTFDGAEHLMAKTGCCGRYTGYSIVSIEVHPGYLAIELDQPAKES